MKGLYFYKLTSPYQEDVTKDCKLTINEIDHNFVTLKNADIKDIRFDEETGLLTLSQFNGEEFVAKIDLSHFTRDFNVKWDKDNSALIFNFDGKEVKIDEFISTIVDNSITNIVEEIISHTITDNTLIGVGVSNNPLGINPLEMPGTYKSVECVINKIEGEYLPNEEYVKKGDRFLTYEKFNRCGNLYNYESVKKINDDLKNGWRVPTKEDWDNMLNAIELCECDKNHSSKICNIDAGKFAGKLLKSNDYWELVDNNTITTEQKDDEPLFNPLLIKGVDSYGFSVLPAGYGDGFDNLNYMGQQSEFWTITETESTDVYVKRFFYNKSSIMQIAKSPTALCSLRLVKDYTGNNFKGIECVNGVVYNTVLMPSENTEYGFAIWLASNVDYNEEYYKPVTPQQGDILMEETVYYINEWDGFQWIRKQLNDGDSLVIKVGPDGDNNREYRLLDGKLVNVKYELKEELLNIVGDINNDINDLKVKNESLHDDLVNNIDDVRKDFKNADELLHQDLSNKISALDQELHQKIESKVSELVAVDQELHQELNRTDETLSQIIKDSVSELETADQELHQEIESKVSELIAADQELHQKIESSVSELETADQELHQKIESKVSELIAANQALHQEIESKVAELIAADQELHQEIESSVSELVAADQELHQTIESSVAELETADQELHQKIESKVATLMDADEELRNSLNESDAVIHRELETIVANFTTEDETLRQELNNKVSELTESDARLQQKLVDKEVELRQELNNKVSELTESDVELAKRLISQEGSRYDCANGVLTLATDDSSKIITIYLNGDYGTF